MALLVLNVLVMIHEFGHFIVAKLCGVKVNEFAIGMGPKLLKWGKGETLYTIRALPIGGFCAMEGEDQEAPTPSALGGNADRENAVAEDHRSFANKKVWQRILIVVAGAAMNLILGFALLLLYNGALEEPRGNSEIVLFPTTTIASLGEDSSAYQSGLRPDDTILSINGRRVLMDMDLTVALQNDADGIFQMQVRRLVDGESKVVSLESVAFELKTDEKTGQRYLVYDFALYGEPRTVLSTISYSAKQELSVATLVWRSLVDIVRGNYGLNDLSGPIGTVDVIADAVGNAVGSTDSLAGWRSLVMLMVMITVNLGVFNLLPLPALDGGRLIFLVWEGITRKPVPAKYESLIHFAGIVLLLMLMLLITFSDIRKMFM